MKRFLTGTSRALAPDGLGSGWKWLIAGVLTFGMAPASLQAQGMRGAMRARAPSMVAASAFTNPYAMNSRMMSPYMMSPAMMSPAMSGNSYMYGNSNAQGSSAMSSGTSGASAGYGEQAYGGQGYGQSSTGQTAPIASATLFGLPSANGRMQWPIGLRILPPANESKTLRDQLELVLYFVATQAAEGQVNHAFTDFGLQAVHDFRQLLRSGEGAMAAVTYTDAMRFLDRAERGLTMIKMMETSSEGAYP